MISVIVPTAHRPQLLMRAVNGVLAQTMSDLEVVVVIDGPDLETTQLLSDIADRRLRFIQNPRITRQRGGAQCWDKSGARRMDCISRRRRRMG